MIFNRDALIASVLIALIGIVGYLAAGNELARERCEETQSADVCAYILR